MNGKLFEVVAPTSEGEFLARYSEEGLCGLEFPSRRKFSKGAVAESNFPPEVRRWHEATIRSLMEALTGKAPSDLPPLDLTGGTEFQRLVWQAMQKIGLGQTKSYGELAEAIGKPKAVRAVGGACGANPIPVLVPCHRVLAANKRLGGFSGGLDWKRRLLKIEGGQMMCVELGLEP